MKTMEKVTCKVRSEYYTSRDPEICQKFEIDTAFDLYFDIEMKVLVKVDDIYKDCTSFQKTIKKGVGSASPYADF